MELHIDHIVVGTETLSAGGTALTDKLGVAVPLSFKHPEMSTHNCLMQAGNGSYFELIAIDPEAANPGRNRWFSLDAEATRRRLSDGPHPLTWVVRTDDLDAIVAASPVDLGEIVTFERGGRTWRLTVAKDGSLPMNGLVPAFIEWCPGPLTCTTLPDLGVRLTEIRLRHPHPARLETQLRTLGVATLARISQGPVELSFALDTPRGVVVLA